MSIARYIPSDSSYPTMAKAAATRTLEWLTLIVESRGARDTPPPPELWNILVDMRDGTGFVHARDTRSPAIRLSDEARFGHRRPVWDSIANAIQFQEAGATHKAKAEWLMSAIADSEKCRAFTVEVEAFRKRLSTAGLNLRLSLDSLVERNPEHVMVSSGSVVGKWRTHTFMARQATADIVHNLR